MAAMGSKYESERVTKYNAPNCRLAIPNCQLPIWRISGMVRIPQVAMDTPLLVRQSAIGNLLAPYVPAISHSRPINLLNGLITAVKCYLQSLVSRRHTQNTPSGSQKSAII